MRLSTRSRYGIRAMFDIAFFGNGAPVSLKNISRRQEISEPYLEQLFAKLRRAELVCSVRGAQGGYYLARPPEEITVGQVLRTLEGSITPAECVDRPECCGDVQACVSHIVWKRISDGLDKVVDAITIQDMLNDAKALTLAQK